MHRIGRAGHGLAVLTLFALVEVLAVHGGPAAASDRSPGYATAPPLDGENAVMSAPYLSASVALIRSQDTRFVDGEDTGHAALYGNEDLFDAGAVGNDLQFQLAAGVRLPYQLRVQLEFGLARDLDWRGNTNYRDTGEYQPSEANLDTRQFLLAGFHDFPGWEIAPDRRARPFLGAGLGITDYRLSGYVQRFPELGDPQGTLRRGPNDEISGLWSGAFALGAVGRDVGRSGDRLAFRLSQPLRVETGSAALQWVSGRNSGGGVVLEQADLSLEPSGRQLDLEVAYSRPWAGGSAHMAAIASHDAGHAAGEREVSILARYSRRF